MNLSAAVAVILGVFMAGAVGMLFGSRATADIYGDCGPSWTPDGGVARVFCRKNYNWPPGTRTLKIKVDDSNFATSGPYYNAVRSFVVPAWNAAVGPQSLKFVDRTGDTEMILYAVTDDQIDNGICALDGCPAQTLLCGGVSSLCLGTSKIVHHSEHYFAIVDIQDPQVRLARMNMSNWTVQNRRWAVAHEMGHGLGLDHNGSTSSLMYATKLDFWTPSTTYETGLPSPCTDGSHSYQWGVRCVFHYTSSAAGGDTP